MGRTAAREDRHIRELDQEQSWQLFDDAAQHYLHISGEEFLELWRSGYYEDPDQPEIMSVLMLLPFAENDEPPS
jgi:hypothetical protein